MIIFECFVINRCLGDLERAEINFFALFFYLLVVCKINFIYQQGKTITKQLKTKQNEKFTNYCKRRKNVEIH